MTDNKTISQELQLVSFEQAIALKELGFDYPIILYFYKNSKEVWEEKQDFRSCNKGRNSEFDEDLIARPEIALVFKWLRDVHSIYVYIHESHSTSHGFRYLVNFGHFIPNRYYQRNPTEPKENYTAGYLQDESKTTTNTDMNGQLQTYTPNMVFSSYNEAESYGLTKALAHLKEKLSKH